MNINLISIARQFFAQYSDSFDDPKRMNAIFMDCSAGESRAHRVAFGRYLEIRCYRALKFAESASDRRILKKVLADQLHAQSGIDIEMCAETLDTLDSAVFSSSQPDTTCTNCHIGIPDGATFCFQCGTPVSPNSARLPPVPQSRASLPTTAESPTRIAYVSAGHDHTIAVDCDGMVWAWGSNGFGQLGNGSHSASCTPVSVSPFGIGASVSAGKRRTAAIRSDKTMHTWGIASIPEGAVRYSASSRPSQVGRSTHWAAVSVGSHHIVAIGGDGSLWAWGNNDHGQLGNGTTVARVSPFPIGADKDWAAVFAGGDHTVALKADGTLWAWG
ncbi:MAG: zinc-ribbon domain-containing protein, partial [Polyangiaceae bacterium]|nr:zinc-ribbon domain-containing protein [Polyangiaceae bacterium]